MVIFQILVKKLVYLRNPCTENAQILQAITGIQENMVEHLVSNMMILHALCTLKYNLCDFWCLMRNSCRRTAKPAIQVMLLFSSTWLCKSTFSVLLGIKLKFRSQISTSKHDHRAIAKVSALLMILLPKSSLNYCISLDF